MADRGLLFGGYIVYLKKMHRLGTYKVLVPPYLFYGTVILICFYWSYSVCPLWLILTCTAGGWVVWTLVEYLLHRFAFHEEPGRPLAEKHDIHWIHHRQPQDPTHIVTSLRLTIQLEVLFFGLFWFIGGGHPAVGAVYGGFGMGYLFYETIHLLIHVHPMPPLRWLRGLWRHHYWHHYRTPDRYYGVTSRWWDYLFGTL
ncbi:MAG: sterol desaturase family protein [Bacteroidia bacterium]|nr:sterol desaturase family protein [Bacteroidia bacterium]